MRAAFVLAGGLGTRLRPHTLVLPKPLMPLGQEAIIQRLLRGIAVAQPRHVSVSLGYLGHLVEAVVGDGSPLGLDISYTHESEPLGTAGALNLLPFELDDDDALLVINGDTLTGLDFNELFTWFESTDATAAMVCVRREILIDFGVVNATEDGVLESISEKPRLSHLLSTGINLMRGRALRELGPGRTDMPDFMMNLQKNDHRVLCYETNTIWMDLGKAEDLLAANDMIADGRL